MARYAAAQPGLNAPDRARVEAEIEAARLPFRLAPRPGGVNALRGELMDIMWREVGVLRTGDGLRRGLERLAAVKAALLAPGRGDGGDVEGGGTDAAFNLSWHDWLNLRNLTDISEVIARAALSRENSRGAHFREDFPDSGALNRSSFTVTRRAPGAPDTQPQSQPDGGIEVTRQPVAFTIVQPGESLLAAESKSG